MPPKSLKAQITEFVNALPADGEWWKRANRDTLVQHIETLTRRGFPLQEAQQIVESIYVAVVQEYGE